MQFWNDFACVHVKQVDTVPVLGSLKNTKTFFRSIPEKIFVAFQMETKI